MLLDVAGQMLGERFAGRGRLARIGWRRRFGRGLGTQCFELFEREFELAEHLVHLLRAAAELHAAQLGDHQLQVLDLGRLFAHLHP